MTPTQMQGIGRSKCAQVLSSWCLGLMFLPQKAPSVGSPGHLVHRCLPLCTSWDPRAPECLGCGGAGSCLGLHLLSCFPKRLWGGRSRSLLRDAGFPHLHCGVVTPKSGDASSESGELGSRGGTACYSGKAPTQTRGLGMGCPQTGTWESGCPRHGVGKRGVQVVGSASGGVLRQGLGNWAGGCSRHGSREWRCPRHGV